MRYLMNHVKVSLTVTKIVELENEIMLELRLPKKSDVVMMAKIYKKRLEGREIKKNKMYVFEGYLKSEHLNYDGFVHQVTLQVTDFREQERKEKFYNEIETVCEFKGRTKIEKVRNDKKVCNIFVSFLSDNLQNSGIEIAVWDSATIPVEYAKEGQKMHLTSFISSNFNTDYLCSLKLCPFKITVL